MMECHKEYCEGYGAMDKVEMIEEIEVKKMHWSTGLLIAVTSFIIGAVAATAMMFLAAHLLLG
jgi:hypothetical protein